MNEAITRVPLDFPHTAPLSLREENVYCSLHPCIRELSHYQDNLVFIPGSSETEVKAFLDDLTAKSQRGLVDASRSMNTFTSQSVMNSSVMRNLLNVRQRYINEVVSLAKRASNPPSNEDVKHITKLRDTIRENVRKDAGVLGGKFYYIADKLRETKAAARQSEVNDILNNSAPYHPKTIERKKALIASAARVNSGLGQHNVQMLQKHAEFLRRKSVGKFLGKALIAVEVSTEIKDLYFAKTDEEQEKAVINLLESGGNLLGTQLGSAAGTIGSAAIAAVFAITLSGPILIGAGIVGGIAGGMFFGEVAEDLAREILF